MVILIIEIAWFTLQNQPSRGVLVKRCTENMQKIFRRTPSMPKFDLNKVALKLFWNLTSAWVLRRFTAIFQNTFFLKHLWRVDSDLFPIRFLSQGDRKNYCSHRLNALPDFTGSYEVAHKEGHRQKLRKYVHKKTCI